MEGKTFHRLDGVYQLATSPVVRQRVGRTGLFTTVLLVVFGLITSAVFPQFTLGETGSASANRLWSSGAELNSTTADLEITGSSGTISISSSTKRSGDYAYRANPTSNNGTFYKTWANSAQSNKFWFRAYLRIATAPSTNTYITQIGSGASGKISVRLTTSSTLQLRNEEDDTNIGSASSALSTNTWYRIEVYVDTTTLSSTDAELRLDGVSISFSTTENLAAGIDRLTWGSSANGTTDLYFDDIAINDSTGRAVDNWPGEGRLVHMQPNADGSNTAWIGDPSDTNDYDDVDEVTPNDDTDFIHSQTNNQLDDNNLEAATSAGIGANDAIKLVSLGVRIRPCGNASGGPMCGIGANINWEARITGGGNTEQSGSITISDSSGWITNDDDSAKLNKITLYDLPGTGTAPWTVTELDSAQIGVANRDSSSTGFRVSTTWLQVEYVDRSGGRLISSGFELNSATAGIEVSAVTNTPTINSTTFKSGAYALQTENGGGQEYARFYFESTNSTGDYYLRAYLNIATTLDNSTATILSLLDTSNLRRAYLKLTTTSTLELWDEDGQIGSASSALSASTWYRIELRLNTVPSGGSHVVDGRIDGVSFASSSTRNVGTGVARIGLGINASDSSESTSNTQGSLIWDDVALNKGIGATQNTWPGAGSIIHLRPNSDDATNTAWTNGFANVDEITPNDSTDIVSETTTGDIDDYNLTDSSIGASDVVNLVSVGVRFRTNSATQEDFKVRVKDSTTGIAIESNILSPASTTWTTNATTDPKLYPLTAYTRPELSTAWTDAQLDTAQVGLRDVDGSGTVEVTTVWLLVEYIPPATIMITGTCDQYDQTTDCVDDGSNQIKVAINGTLQPGADTTVDGAWSVGITQPNTGDIITVFIDGSADNNEAVAVTKYDGTGDITSVVLYQRHLTIGSADNQTITNADLASYDNSVSGDEDIFFDVSAGNDLTVDSLGSYTDERLFIVTGNTFRPASGGGADVTTVHTEIDGTWTADSNAITVAGDWQNDGTFSAGTSTITFTSTTTGRTIAGTISGTTGKFYNVTFNGSGGEWTNSAALEIANDLTMTTGTLAGTNNVTVVGHTQGTSGVINRTGGTFKQGATTSKNFGTTSGTTAWTFSDLTFANDLGICTGITYTTQTGGTGGITVSGILRVGESGDGAGCTTTLNAGNRTWTLSGTGGDPFQLLASPTGVLTASTSTFTYTGNSIGNTIVQSATYYNLTINNSSETYTLESATNVGNDLTITNGTLDTTTSNHNMSITRDVLIANSATANFRARGSTITVSRHWSKGSSGVFTRDSSTVQLNGDGEIQTVGGGQTQFENLTVAYSTKTTTMTTATTHVFGVLTVNSGTLTCSVTCSFQLFRTAGADLSLNASATLSGSNATFVLRKQAASTVTVTGGTNYGTWNILMYSNVSASGLVTFNVGAAITTSGYMKVKADADDTATFNTANFTINADKWVQGDPTNTGSTTSNWGSSAATFSRPSATDTFYVDSNGGSHTANFNTASISATGHVKFVNGTGTLTVDKGTSTFTFAPTTGTSTFSPNGQSLYNAIVNGAATVQPDAAVAITNDLTMTAGTLSGTQNITVNGTVQGTAGIINLTGGTFNQRVTANENFGTTSGSTAWTFYNLKFSNASVLDSWWTITTQTGGTGGITVSNILQVGDTIDVDSIILTAGNRIWTLSGTTGDPFQVQTAAAGFDAVTPGTSTFTYTGNNAGGNTTVERNALGVGYYNLDINNASETFVLEGNTTVGNDLTVTNGVLSTTGSNFSLTVTRDLTLANTAGVGLTGNGSTITVGRDWNDLGNKFTQAGSSVVMNGTGNLNLVGNYGFNNISMAYSGFTTTLASGTLFPDNDGIITLNGGTYAMGSNYTHVNRGTSGTSLVFASPTTITSSGIGFSFANMSPGITQTVPGANYGNANIVLQVSRGGGTGNIMQFGGNVTTTGAITAHSYSSSGTTTGSFNTQGHSLSASSVSIGHGSFTDGITIDFGASVITLSSTGNSLAVVSTVGGQTHQLNMQSSSVSVSGSVLFVNGSGTMNVNPGTSTVTWVHTSGTKSYAPNGQSLYNLTIDGAGGTLTPTAAVDVNNNFTITNGVYDTVNGSNYSLTVDNNFTGTSGTWTFQARAATITVSGNWDTSAIGADDASFVRGTSTVVMNGTGTKTITTGSTNVWQHRFYNLTVGQSGNTTRMMQTFGVENQINLGTGTFDLNSRLLYNSGTNANFLNLNPSGTWGTGNGAYAPYGSNNKNIPAFTYNSGLQTEQNTGFKTIFQGNASFTSFLIGCCSRASEIDINGYTVTVTGNVTFGTTTAILTLGSGTLNVGGNWVNTNNAVFNANTGTVVLNGTSTQTLSGLMTGSSSFYNLTITNSSGTNASDCERTGFVAGIDFAASATVTNNTVFTTASSRIEFNSGSTYTLTNINWNGQAIGTRLYFRNSAVSGSWNLNVSGTQTAVSYVNVSRSNASSGNTIMANDGTNFDCGNNVNWNFSNPDAPSDLAQKKTNDTVIATGGWTNETSVKFTATASDTDSSDTLYLCVEKDLLGTGFSNTEDLCGTGVAYSGTPVTVTVTISGITDASEYHWQARVKDQGGVYGSWVSYGGNVESARDFGVDTTACTFAGTVNDGNPGDDEFNGGSLTTLEAAWDTFSCGASGILRYEVSFGTTVGGTDILNWTNNGTDIDTSQGGLNLRTNQRYYANVRAIDNASNTSSVYSSNGQYVLPAISLTLGSTTITFSNLNDANNRTDTKTLNLTTSTNAYGGYVIRQYATGLLTNGSFTIPMFQGGTYASPGSWPGGFCTGGSNCGYGYTSNDTTIQGSNKFSSGTLYASFATAAFGDIVADHTDAVTGATGPVTNQAFTVTHKVAVDALQAAKNYQTEVLYIVTGTF